MSEREREGARGQREKRRGVIFQTTTSLTGRHSLSASVGTADLATEVKPTWLPEGTQWKVRLIFRQHLGIS